VRIGADRGKADKGRNMARCGVCAWLVWSCVGAWSCVPCGAFISRCVGLSCFRCGIRRSWDAVRIVARFGARGGVGRDI
jgi:hypothetical protein